MALMMLLLLWNWILQHTSAAFPDTRIFMIMIESFSHGVSGASGYGAGCGYGPSNHTGNFAGVIDALPYIASTHATTIWLSPIFDSGYTPATCRLDATGYYAQDYFNVDPRFGTFDEINQIIDTAHDLGMTVLFDLVLGHHKTGLKPSPSGNLPTNPINFREQTTIDFFNEVITYWMQNTNVDGFRFDQIYQVPTDIVPIFINTIRSLCRRKNSDECFTVGEVLCSEDIVEQNGLGHCTGVSKINQLQINQQKYFENSNRTSGIPTVFDFTMMFQLRDILFGNEWGNLPNATKLGLQLKWNRAYGFGKLVLPLNNHDFLRPGNVMWRYKTVDRFVKPKDYWKRYQLAFSFLTAYPGILILLLLMLGPIQWTYNDEVGATTANFADKVEIDCASVGLCDDHSGRINAKLSNFNTDELELKQHVTKLMKFRSSRACLVAGQSDFEIVHSDEFVLIIERFGISGCRLLYAMNISDTLQTRSITINKRNFWSWATKVHLDLQPFESRFVDLNWFGIHSSLI
ncbi:hypothetical protein HDV02_006381 [Globomyces sp. JEL0801]|nr:hypothetical protein HDV02_006381 [Globomyces sp. JEL0801]